MTTCATKQMTPSFTGNVPLDYYVCIVCCQKEYQSKGVRGVKKSLTPAERKTLSLLLHFRLKHFCVIKTQIVLAIHE